MQSVILLLGVGFVSALVAYKVGKTVAEMRAQVKIDKLSRVSPLNCQATFHVFFGERTVCRCGNMSAGKLLAKARKHG